MVLWVRVVCICHRLTREAHGVTGGCSVGAGGSAIAGSRGQKTYPRRLKKCQASHARHIGHMFIMRRRRETRPTAASVPLLSIGGRCRGVGWGPKKVRFNAQTFVIAPDLG